VHSFCSSIYNIKSGTWRKGPGLEGIDDEAGAVQLKTTFLVIGGKSNSLTTADTIWYFDTINYEFVLKEQRLSSPKA